MGQANNYQVILEDRYLNFKFSPASVISLKSLPNCGLALGSILFMVNPDFIAVPRCQDFRLHTAVKK